MCGQQQIDKDDIRPIDDDEDLTDGGEVDDVG